MAQISVGDYLDAWLAHVKGRVRQRTHEGYEALIRIHAKPAIGEIGLADLRPLDLQELYSSVLARRSAGTVVNLHLVLTQALSQAVRWGYVAVNAASGAQPPRPQRKELTVLDQAGVEAILAAAEGTRMEAPVAIAIATGMRRGEVLGLRWSDMDPDFLTARVSRSLQRSSCQTRMEAPKTARSRRAVVLPAMLRPHLERQRADQDRRRVVAGDGWEETKIVVDYANGRPWRATSFPTAFAKFLREAGLPHVRFHDLRHAHATLMLSKGVHPKIVSERLGHASIGITLDTYSHVPPSMQQDAADAFDEIFMPTGGLVPDHAATE